MAYNSGTLTVSPWPMGGSVMRKLEISDPEIMGVAIRQEIERNDESRYDHRLHGLLLVVSGVNYFFRWRQLKLPPVTPPPVPWRRVSSILPRLLRRDSCPPPSDRGPRCDG